MSNVPKTTPNITLVPITEDNFMAIAKLSKTLTPSQQNCVADNLISIAQAGLSENAWMRGIYLGEAPIGFIMLDLYPDPREFPEKNHRIIYLWRFMIAKEFQGKGYGKKALDMVAKHFGAQGVQILYTSCVKKEADTPYQFYLNYGFTDTGVVESDEQVLRYALPLEIIHPINVKPLPATPKIDLVTLWTDNLQAMKDFYHRILGFYLAQDLGSYVEFENNGCRFALCSRTVMAGLSGEFTQPTKGQRVELAFPCDKPEDVDLAYNQLLEQGVRGVAAPWTTDWGQRAALFADPDGNIHEFFANIEEK